jgi:nucleoid DNA-binding protein
MDQYRAEIPRVGLFGRRPADMTKAEIVEDIANKTGLTKKDVATAMDQFLEAISRALVDGKHYEIRGFGTFKVKNRKARMARNPRTGEAVPVPDRKVPVFKVSKELKDLVANA